MMCTSSLLLMLNLGVWACWHNPWRDSTKWFHRYRWRYCRFGLWMEACPRGSRHNSIRY